MLEGEGEIIGKRDRLLGGLQEWGCQRDRNIYLYFFTTVTPGKNNYTALLSARIKKYHRKLQAS